MKKKKIWLVLVGTMLVSIVAFIWIYFSVSISVSLTYMEREKDEDYFQSNYYYNSTSVDYNIHKLKVSVSNNSLFTIKDIDVFLNQTNDLTYLGDIDFEPTMSVRSKKTASKYIYCSTNNSIDDKQLIEFIKRQKMFIGFRLACFRIYIKPIHLNDVSRNIEEDFSSQNEKP